MEIDFSINGKMAKVDVDPAMPLLWVVRDELNLKATKFGCGAALCGACTLHIDGEAYRSCSIPVSFAAGKKVTTLEGLSESEDKLHPIQQAWMEENVPQCGYCQPGFVTAATAVISADPKMSRETALAQLTNLCRCGTYDAIRQAVGLALDTLQAQPTQGGAK